MTPDEDLAVQLATDAGAMLLKLQRGETCSAQTGATGDRIANRFLIDALRAARPAEAILSEEEVNDVARCAVQRVWIVDPLDGTREFAEGRDDWAVHVALAIGGVARIGAVALPALGMTLSSAAPPPRRPANAPLRMVVSRTRPAAEAVRVAKALGADLVPMGSAGAKAMAVVRGEADIYLHTGGQYEWDNCAPVAVAAAAGFSATRVDGSRLVYNNPDPYLPDLLICAPDLLAAVLAALPTDRN